MALNFESHASFLQKPVVFLKDFQLGSEGIKQLADIFSMISDKNLSVVKAINFTGNQIGDTEIELLVPILQKLSNLNAIDFSRNDIGDKGVKILATWFQVSSLRHINLATNKIGPAGAEYLADILYGSSISYLNLYDNFIADYGITKLAIALQGNEVLETLNVSLNMITPRGAANLGEALSTNKTLNKIHIHNNNIGKEGAEAIVVALMPKQNFVAINLSRNNIPDWLVSKVFTLNINMIEAAYQFESKYKEVHAVRKGLVQDSFIPVVDEKLSIKKKVKVALPVYLKTSPPQSAELVQIRDQLNKDFLVLQGSISLQKQSLQKLMDDYNNSLLAKALEDFASEDSQDTAGLLEKIKAMEMQFKTNEKVCKELEKLIHSTTEENASILSTCEIGRTIMSKIIQLYEGSPVEPSLDSILGYMNK